MIWLRFVGVQLLMLFATIVGWLLLIPFCLLQFWEYEPQGSIKDERTIDVWKWVWLNKVYGNPEDGVSGQQAIVYTTGVAGPYMPLPDWLTRFTDIPIRRFLAWIYPAWRAYLWSAWRNSADNLKYVFADADGPLVTFQLFGRTAKIGWQLENGYKVPVLSL